MKSTNLGYSVPKHIHCQALYMLWLVALIVKAVVSAQISCSISCSCKLLRCKILLVAVL